MIEIVDDTNDHFFWKIKEKKNYLENKEQTETNHKTFLSYSHHYDSVAK